MSPSRPGGTNHRPLVIGLTGGIGSGKTTVAALFEQFDVPVIDADVIARAVVAPGQPALREIVEVFGPDSIDAAGRLDRDHLRKLVFSDPLARHRLEAIVHPRIRRETVARIADIRSPYCIVVIPLLLESDQRDLVDRILVIDAPVSRQIERVVQRSGLSRQEIDAIIAAQTTRETRLAAADDVINNDGSLDQLESRARALHEKYLRLTRNHDG